MWSFIVLLSASAAIALAGYAGSPSTSENTPKAPGGGAANAGSPTGGAAGVPLDGARGPPVGAGGFGGGFSQAGAGTAGSFPQFPPLPNFNFDEFLSGYFESLRKYHMDFQGRDSRPISWSYSFNSPQSSSQAQSSLTFQDNQLNELQQHAAGSYGFPGGFPAFAGFPQGGQAYGPGQTQGGSYGPGGGFAQGAGVGQQGQGGYGGSFGGSFGPGTGGAAASASLGPGGVHQTAGVYPENPNMPNVNTRFGGGAGSPDGSHFSVFTSSVSSSSDVNGKPSSFHQASTTVNDNGKVSTYTVRNP